MSAIKKCHKNYERHKIYEKATTTMGKVFAISLRINNQFVCPAIHELQNILLQKNEMASFS